MILKLDTLFSCFIFSVYADIKITTDTGVTEFLNQYRIDIHNSTSIFFKVKACYEAFVVLQEKGTYSGFEVVFYNKTKVTFRKGSSDFGYTSWSGMDCNCYVSLWISWIDRQIAVGKGTRIGTDIVYNLTFSSTTDMIVDDIRLSSTSTAFWLFDFPINATAETTTSGFSQEPKGTNAPTKSIRPGYNPTTTSTTETSPAFNPTTIGSTETTTQGLYPTSVGTIITLATKTSGTTKHIETTSTKMSCICSCNNFTLTEDELITKIALLKSELSVDPKLTNKYKRSLISASDDRPSSKCIGTFGIVVLVVICTLIVLMDFQHYARFIFNKQK